MSNDTGDGTMNTKPRRNTMSAKLGAYMLLKSVRLIDQASDARYLCCIGGDHFFGLVGGDVCAVDLVTRTVKSSGVVVLRGVL